MNISNRHKYLYFVVPKCASKTIRQSLGGYTDIGYPKPSPLWQHTTINDFFKTDYYSLFEEYFKFTFVRNPYDKLYSGFLQDVHAAKSYNIFNAIGEDFNRYMLEYVAESDVNNDWRYIHFCPMYEFASIDNELCLDWFGKVENVENDLIELSTKLGINIEKRQNSNVRNKPVTGLKYLDKYTRSSVELVNTLYEKDFEMFSYPILNPMDFPEKL